MLNAFQVHAHTYTHAHTQACHMCDTHTLRQREGGGGVDICLYFVKAFHTFWFGRLGFCFCSWHSHWHFCHALLQFLRRPEQDKCQQFLLIAPVGLPPLICYKLFEFRFNLQQLFQYSVLNSIWKSCKVFACAFPDNEYTYHIRYIAILTYVTHSKRKHK